MNRTRTFVALWSWAVIGFLNLPILMIMVLSFSAGEYLSFPLPGLSLRWYQGFFGSDRWIEATFNSFEIAFAVMVGATVLGVAASFGLTRGRLPGSAMVLATLNVPIIVPGIVSAVAFYFFFSRFGLIGSKNAIILAHTALATPLVVINVATALRSFDIDLERAARSLGASRWRAFWHVTRPGIQPAILSGALFAFLLSFDELVVAVFIGGAGTTTLPMRMWNSLRDEIDPTVAAISTLLIVLSAILIFGASLVGKRAPVSAPSRTL